jgi:hypothetical protein
MISTATPEAAILGSNPTFTVFLLAVSAPDASAHWISGSAADAMTRTSG